MIRAARSICRLQMRRSTPLRWKDWSIAGSSQWTYVLEDEGVALHFGFIDGRVDNVYAAGLVR